MIIDKNGEKRKLLQVEDFKCTCGCTHFVPIGKVRKIFLKDEVEIHYSLDEEIGVMCTYCNKKYKSDLENYI